MKIYLVPIGQNNLTRRGREPGHRYMRLNAVGRRQVRAYSDQLLGRKVVRVYASDLDQESAIMLARRLRVPATIERDLRGLNLGRLAGQRRDRIEKILEKKIARWSERPEIPLPGGDSWISFKRRFVAAVHKIALFIGNEQATVLITDLRGIRVVRELVDPKPEALLDKYADLKAQVYVVEILPAAAQSRPAEPSA